jgi:hypothetical protein
VDAVTAWESPDGISWVYAPETRTWRGIYPGLDELYQRTIPEFRASYPYAPLQEAVRMRTPEEVNDELDKVDSEASAGGKSRWPAMNYEQGVYDTLRWVLGWTDESPTGE